MIDYKKYLAVLEILNISPDTHDFDNESQAKDICELFDEKKTAMFWTISNTIHTHEYDSFGVQCKTCGYVRSIPTGTPYNECKNTATC